MFAISNKSESLYRRLPEGLASALKAAVKAEGGKVRCTPEPGGEVSFRVRIAFSRAPGWAANAEAHGRAVPLAAHYRDTV